jgi:hypothetical protein
LILSQKAARASAIVSPDGSSPNSRTSPRSGPQQHGHAGSGDGEPHPAAAGSDQRLTDTVGYAELADTLGLDVFGVGEHHSADFAVPASSSAGRSMATRPSPTGPWACRPRRRPAGRWPPFSANAQAGVNTMPASEVTIACGVLIGRKPDAFSDRASHCGAFSPPSEPRQPAYPLTSRRAARKWSPSRAAICCGGARAPRRRPARTPAACRPTPGRSASPGPRSPHPPQHPRWSEARYLGWSR